MGRSAQDGDVLLVGSLPFKTSEEAITRMGKGLGDHLFSIPDGEVGPRSIWVGYAISLFQANPHISPTEGSEDPDFIAPDKATQAEDSSTTPPLQFTVTDPDKLVFETAGYADYAISSYEIFKRERDAGNIAEGVRFQVTFPGVASQIEFFFAPESWPVMTKAFEGAVKRDIERIAEVVPAEDLCVQYDLCFELMDLAAGDDHRFPYWPKRTYEEKVAHHAEQLKELPKYVPGGALMGLHLCYGTWGGWPMIDMEDLDVCVRIANEAARLSPREWDYIHMPVTPDADDAFFAPLANLDISGSRLFLGMIHFHEGQEEFKRRFEAASKYAQDFGVASVCGFGRVSEDELDSVIKAHVDAAHVLERVA